MDREERLVDIGEEVKPSGKESKYQPENQVEIMEVMYSLLNQVDKFTTRVKQLEATELGNPPHRGGLST